MEARRKKRRFAPFTKRATAASLLVACLLSLTSSLSADPNDVSEIRARIARLDARLFSEREMATRQLLRDGAAAAPLLAEAADGESFEVTFRAIYVLRVMLDSGDAETTEAAVAALGDLSASKNISVSRRAKAARAYWVMLKQGHAIQRLEQLGGRMTFSGEPGHVDTTLAVSLGGDWNGSAADLPLLQQLYGLTDLSLRDSKSGDDVLAHVGRLRSLRSLDLGGTDVSNKGLDQIAGLVDLQELDLSKTMIGDDGIRRLKPLKKLRTLNLCGTLVTDRGMEHIGPLGQLATLCLSETRVTNRGFARLADVPALETLDVRNTQIEMAGLRALGKIPTLKSIDARQTRIGTIDARDFKRIRTDVELSFKQR